MHLYRFRSGDEVSAAAAMEEVPEGRSRGRGQELLLIKCVIRTDAILISLRSCFNLGDRDNSARLAQDFC